MKNNYLTELQIEMVKTHLSILRQGSIRKMHEAFYSKSSLLVAKVKQGIIKVILQLPLEEKDAMLTSLVSNSLTEAGHVEPVLPSTIPLSEASKIFIRGRDAWHLEILNAVPGHTLFQEDAAFQVVTTKNSAKSIATAIVKGYKSLLKDWEKTAGKKLLATHIKVLQKEVKQITAEMAMEQIAAKMKQGAKVKNEYATKD